MTISVVDEAGRLVLTARGDGTGFFSPETSRAKAMAAASFKKRTAELAELVAKGGFWSIVPTILGGHAPTPCSTNTTTATKLVSPDRRFLMTLAVRNSSARPTDRIARIITLIPAPK